MPEPRERLSLKEEALRDVELLESIRPPDDPSTGLPIGDTKQYDDTLDLILKKWGSFEAFSEAVGVNEGDTGGLPPIVIRPGPGQGPETGPGPTPTTPTVSQGAPVQGPPAPSPDDLATLNLQDLIPFSIPVADETPEGLRDRLIQEIINSLPDALTDEVVPGQITDPPFTEELAKGAGRVIGAFEEGFEREFNPTVTPNVRGSETIPGLGPGAPVIDPLLRGLSFLGEKMVEGGDIAIQGITGATRGTFEAGTALIQEFGFDKTEARKIMRDVFAAMETGTIMSVTHPGKAGQAFMKASGLQRAGRLKVQWHEERKAVVAARKINSAKRRIRAEAKKLGLDMTETEARIKIATTAVREKLEQLTAAPKGVVIRSPEEILDYVPKLTTEALTPQVQKDAIEIARRVLDEYQSLKGVPPNAVAGKRVQDTIYSLLTSDDAFTIRLQGEVNAAGMSWETFLDAFLVTGSEAGRTLALRSRFYDRLRKNALKGDKNAEEILKTVKKASSTGKRVGLTTIERMQPMWQRGGKLFRMLVLTLPSTAVRNALDATLGRVNIGAMNRVIDESLRRLYPAGREMAGPLDPFGELGRIYGVTITKVEDIWLPKRLRGFVKKKLGAKRRLPAPKALVSKAEIEKIFAAYPEILSKLRRALEVDVGAMRVRDGTATMMDHIEHFVSRFGLFMNRAQEFVIRDQVFAAALDQNLRRLGSSIDEMIEFGDIPVGFDWAAKKAIHQALDITFALDPAKINGPLARMFDNFGKMINAIPGGPIFIETFPAFLFNIVKFTIEHTPTAGLRLVSPKHVARIAEGDMNVVGKELTGTVLLTAALAIRQGMVPALQPGARYDEFLNEKGERVSIQPFASMAPHMFIADFLIRVNEGRILGNADDLRELRRGLTASSPQTGRLTSVGEDLIESLANIDSTADFKNFLSLTGEKVGAALRPLELHRIWMEETNEEWRLMREVQGQGFWAATRNMIGPLGPERESATRKATNIRTRVDLPFGLGSVSSGLAAQFTGLLRRESRMPIERELVKMGFGSKDLNPKMHNARLNALVLRFQGEFLEIAGNEMVKLMSYRRLGVKAKQNDLRVLLSGGFSRTFGSTIEGVRAKAIRAAKLLAPFAFELRDFKTLPGTEKEAFIRDYNRVMERTGIMLPAEEFLQWLEWETDRDLKRQGL